MDISAKVLEYEPYIIEQRRYFHRIPELAWEEVRTTLGIEEQLKKLGLTPIRFEGISGVYAEIIGAKRTENSKTILLRADIDGVEVQEETGLPFASVNQGVMHASGRDCHIAMLLGAVGILKEMEGELEGKVRILFQAAEESAQGAPEYIKQGILEGVDAVYGAHVYAGLPSSKLDITYGYRMASADKIDIEIRGDSVHGSMPHLGQDAIVASALVINAVQNYVARRNNPLDPLVISIGTIHGGHQRNTLADYVKMEGTVRTHSMEARNRVEKELQKLIVQTSEIMGCRAKVHYKYMLPPLSNDSGLTSIAYKAAERLFGEQAIVHVPPIMASEDFAFYTENIPGIYVNIGCALEDNMYGYSNYSPHFQVDESVLKKGTALCVQFVKDFFGKGGK